MNYKINELKFKTQQTTLFNKVNNDKIEKLTEENVKLKENILVVFVLSI